MRDIHSNPTFKVALKATKFFRNTVDEPDFVTVSGNIIDLQGFRGLEFVILAGDITDGVYRPLIEHSDQPDLYHAPTVSDQDLVGEEDNVLAIGTTSEIRKVGYFGSKRYVRLSMTGKGFLAGGTISAIAVLGKALQVPV